MSRPPGTNFLGVQNTKVKANVVDYHGLEANILMDTGSDITLISEDFYKTIPERPRRIKGRKVELTQAVGDLTVDSFTILPLYFKTNQGTVELEVEAYIMPKMKRPIIIGNDYQDQFNISVVREEKGGTKVKFGESGHEMPAYNSTFSEEKFTVLSLDIELPSILQPKDATVVVTQTERIPPHSGKMISVTVNWPEGLEEMVIEPLETFNMEGESSYLMEAIINKATPKIAILNRGSIDLVIPQGQQVGYARNPLTFYQKKLKDIKIQAQVNAIQAIVRSLIKKEPRKIPCLDDEDKTLFGPKGAQMPEVDEEVPKDRLLQEVNFNPSLPEDKRKALEKVVQDNERAFGLDKRLGTIQHEIALPLKEGTKPIAIRPYPLSKQKMEDLDKQVELWLQQGVIEPSKSPWGFPVVIVYRNDKPRICVDYRQANTRIERDEFPLPRQDQVLQALQGAQWLSTLDALSGFNQMRIKTEDQPITAFRTPKGLYHFKKLPFGIHNGPAEFQRAMNDIMAQFLWIFIIVYIDDLIVYSKTFEDHVDHLTQILQAVIESGMTLAPKKCFFGFQSLALLGQKVSRLGLTTQKEKVEAIDKLAPPKNIKTLQSFLGMMVYYASYIPYYAWIVNPLFKLLHKDQKWEWSEKHKEAWELSKQTLKSAPILGYGIPGLGYRLYTDASYYGIAGVLHQVQPVMIRDLQGTRIYDKLKTAWDNKEEIPILYKEMPEGSENPRKKFEWAKEFELTWVWVERPILYGSRSLRPAEDHYSPTELEALAAKEFLIKFQNFLEGERILLVTDHSALIWSKTYSGINRRLLNTGNVFSQFRDLTVTYRPGRMNSNVDPLSRLEQLVPEHQSPEKDPDISIELGQSGEPITSGEWRKLVYKDNKAAEVFAIESIQIDQEVIEKYRKGYKTDTFFKRIMEDLKGVSDWSDPRHTLFFIKDNGLLYKYDTEGRELLCIPKDMQKEILQLHEELGENAHFGFEKTYNYLSRSFYWPKMVKSVKRYQETCDTCQKIHNDRRLPYGRLQPIPIPQYPFQEVSMDFIMPLTESGGYNGVYVVVDRFTKYVIIRPVTTRITAEETAEKFKSMVIIDHGLPEKVISDRDPRWREAFWGQLLVQIGSKTALSTAYHPQTDGQTEAVNQILEIALRAYTQEGTWHDKLEDFQMAYNSSVHSSTGFTPFFLLNGKQMRKPSNLLIDQSQHERVGIDKQSTELFLDRMEAAWNRAKEALQFAQEVQRRSYNANHTPLTLEVGDQVLVNPHSLRMSGDWQKPGHKLLPRWEGPFEIIEKFGPNTYQIRLPPDWDIHPVLHVAHLKPYKSSDPEFDNRSTIPIRKRKETDKEDWEIKRITAERYGRRKRKEGPRPKQYQGIWIIDDKEEWTDEWVPAANFKNAPEVLAQWKNELKLHPEKRAI